MHLFEKNIKDLGLEIPDPPSAVANYVPFKIADNLVYISGQAPSKNGKIIALQEQSFEEYSHSKSLHVFIDKLFKEIELLPNDLSAVAISEGPGSYTGLRIGVSAAKGICFALNIPLIAIDTMHILARKIECSKGYIISAMDARRDEIYYSIFRFGINYFTF